MRVWCDDTTCRFNNCGISCTKESVDLEREQLGGKVYVVCDTGADERTVSGECIDLWNECDDWCKQSGR